MAKKKTLEEVKQTLLLINPNIEIVDTEYINSKKPLKCKCLLDENIFYMNWNNLSFGHGCNMCSLNKAITSIEYIKTFVEKHGFELVDIENKHLAPVKFKIIIKCKHNHTSKRAWRDFHNKRQTCTECNRHIMLEKIGATSRTSIKTIEEFVHTRSCKIIFGLEDYKSEVKTNLYFQCDNGHQWTCTFATFKRQNGCPECNGILKNKYTYDCVSYYLKKLGCTIISNELEYKNSKVPFAFECSCGNIDKITFEEFMKHKKCKNCRGVYVSYAQKFINDMFSSRDCIVLTEMDTYSKTDRIRYICSCGCADSKKLHEWLDYPWCKECGLKNRSGESHPDWNGGISDLRKNLRYSVKWWTRKSLKFYNNRCAITLEPSTVVHHLYGFELILNEVMNITGYRIYSQIGKYTEEEFCKLKKECSNLHKKYGLGVVLHPKIHDLFHYEYKYGNNTPQQFEEFKQRLKQGEFDTYLQEHNLSLAI